MKTETLCKILSTRCEDAETAGYTLPIHGQEYYKVGYTGLQNETISLEDAGNSIYTFFLSSCPYCMVLPHVSFSHPPSLPHARKGTGRGWLIYFHCVVTAAWVTRTVKLSLWSLNGKASIILQLWSLLCAKRKDDTQLSWVCIVLEIRLTHSSRANLQDSRQELCKNSELEEI